MTDTTIYQDGVPKIFFRYSIKMCEEELPKYRGNNQWESAFYAQWLENRIKYLKLQELLLNGKACTEGDTPE